MLPNLHHRDSQCEPWSVLPQTLRCIRSKCSLAVLLEVLNLGNNLVQLVGDLVVGDRTVHDVVGQKLNHFLNLIHAVVEADEVLLGLGLGVLHVCILPVRGASVKRSRLDSNQRPAA